MSPALPTLRNTTSPDDRGPRLSSRPRLPRVCKREAIASLPCNRVYIPSPRVSLPGIHLGLSTSDLPDAGLGVFVQQDYRAGTRLATYEGRRLLQVELEELGYDTTYVWSDLDQRDRLARRGQLPLIIDAHPRLAPLDWGGMINDGLTRPANVQLKRHRDVVYVTLLSDCVAHEELYLEYGAPYWQDRFPSLPVATQAEVLTAYGLIRCGPGCYTAAELRHMQRSHTAHRHEGVWYPGPNRPTAPASCSTSQGPSQDTLLPWLLGVPNTSRAASTLNQWCCTSPPVAASESPGSPPAEDHLRDNALTISQMETNAQAHYAQVPPLEVSNTLAGSPPLEPLPDPLILGTGLETTHLPSAEVPPAPSATDAFWYSLRGQYGYRDNAALRVSLGTDKITRYALTQFLSTSSEISAGTLTHFIMHCPYIHLHVWKPSSLLLGPCVPSHPLSGYYCDALFKELRFASNWDPRYLPHLDLTDGTQRYALLTHIRRLSQLPNLSTEFGDALTAAATWLAQPSSHADTSSLLPWQLRWSRESASLDHPYSWFSTSPELFKNTSAGSDTSAMAGWAILTTDTRFEATCDFTYAELVTILEQPIYGLWALQRCIPMKPPSLPRGDLAGVDWAIYSLSGLLLASWHEAHTPARLLPSRRKRPSPTDGTQLRALPPPVHSIHWHETDAATNRMTVPDPDPSWQRGRHYVDYQRDSQRDAYRTLTLHGLGLSHQQTDLLSGSLNVNGLTLSKVTEILWYMRHRRLDVLILLDTRCGVRESSRMCRHIRTSLGTGSGAYACPAFGPSASRTRTTATRASMVGGQLILLSPHWATRVIRVIDDPTHLGVMFGVLLSGPAGPIQILGVYWPCPPPSTGELHMGLHSKLQQWLHRMTISLAPMDYLRGLIRGRVLRHLGHSTDVAPHPMSLVLGDFNASWDNRHGPHKGLGVWAGSCGLINPFSYVAHMILYPLASFYAGLRPVGLIDHGLISHSFMGLVTLSALDDGSFWSTVSDHRPILLGLSLTGASHRHLGHPLKRPSWGKVEVPSTPALLQQYQAQLMDRPSIPVTDVTTTCSYLYQVSVDSAAIAAALTPAPRLKGKRWKDGWSPLMMCLKANLEVLWHIWGHLRGTSGHTTWRTQVDMDNMIQKVLAPWEKRVHSYIWTPPLHPEAVLALGGYPPSFWKTTTLRKLDTG